MSMIESLMCERSRTRRTGFLHSTHYTLHSKRTVRYVQVGVNVHIREHLSS
jgi:hypothetical protein